MHVVSKVETMRNNILQHNIFLTNIATVPINNKLDKMSITRKTYCQFNSLFWGELTREATKGKYLFITNKSVVRKT